jgi:pyridinium-3,5-bisthiocarboxylic acid mononucleotide nickel chelatase
VALAWFHCFSGIAGDMALGALLDAGADVDEVRDMIAGVPVSGWGLRAEVVQRAGLRATRAVVHAPEDPDHHRTFSDLRDLLAGADLPDRVRARTVAVFTALADAEGRLHGVPADAVHFHEVGALDAIVDVVGTCAALELLDVDEVRTSPVTVGLGSVRAAHGELPNPAPASLALLAAAGIPVTGVASAVELTTPTGAALLAGLAAGSGPLPPMTPASIGYGAGGRDVAGRANVVQIVIGAASPAAEVAALSGPGQPMVELATNLDDVSGEVLAHTLAALLAAGANDAWITPIVMKKGRPAHTLHALCDPARAEAVGSILLAESGSLGLRATAVERWPQVREELVVDLDGHAVRVKRAGHRVKAEHDDAAAAARALGRPLREVLAEIERRAGREL